ncbi:MAG: glycosyltransferase [bacterium]
MAPPPGLRVVDALARERAGGVERYGRWLVAALEARGVATDVGVTLALKPRAGAEIARTGDGVSAAWVAATGRSRWRWARHVARERAAVGAARRVIALSPMVAAELAHWYGRHDAQVLLNPVFAPSAAPSSATAGALVFVGHGFSRKGLDHAFAALVHLPGVSLHVVGADGHAARWRARARRLGLSNRLIFHGEVEAAPLIAGAAALVHPARYEPYGNVVAEALAAGVPAVASPATGAACLLHPDHIWDPTSGPPGLARCLRVALDTPRPPVAAPPSPAAHLDALLALVAR